MFEQWNGKGYCVLQVEFPEARIYEETLNVLLYEHRDKPDMELMQATKGHPTTSHGYHSDEDTEERLESRMERLRRK